MTTMRLIATAALKRCHSCLADVPARDIYCRKCGTPLRTDAITEPTLHDCRSQCEPSDEGSYQSLSSPLVNRLSQTLATRSAALCVKPSSERMVAALITIPIWLLIIVLSPLDAYAAARAGGKAENVLVSQERKRC